MHVFHAENRVGEGQGSVIEHDPALRIREANRSSRVRPGVDEQADNSGLC